MKHKAWWLTVAAAAFAAGLLVQQVRTVNAEGEPTREEIRKKLASLPDTCEPIRLVAKLAEPSVVHINSMRLVRVAAPAFPIDPLLRDFFGEDWLEYYYRRRTPRRGYVLSNLGSGFVVDARRGLILTNAHVIQDADEVSVSLADGKELSAEIVGADRRTDIAVLKIEAEGLGSLELGDSDKLAVGEWVLACGNPFGLDRTVTLGIVSAKGRRGMGISDYEDFIQTDCAINPGNSGGPLVDIRGRVVGINTAILSRSGGYQGIGFAVPINVAKTVMEQILQYKRVVRGWLGMTASDISPDWIKKYNIPGEGGAYVLGVAPGGPADKAGLEKGDIIVAIDGANVQDTSSLYNRVALMRPGTKIVLGVYREGKVKKVTLVVDEQPEGR